MRNRGAWLLVVVTLVGIGAILVGGAVVARYEPPARVRINPVPPEVTGLDLSQATEVLAAAGFDLRVEAVIAGDDLPEGLVRDQFGPADMVVGVEVSGGGPIISAAELPPEAFALVSDDLQFDPAEPIRAFDTEAGVAYKVDHLLFGPCDAVDLAYRQFLDSRYDDDCY